MQTFGIAELGIRELLVTYAIDEGFYFTGSQAGLGRVVDTSARTSLFSQVGSLALHAIHRYNWYNTGIKAHIKGDGDTFTSRNIQYQHTDRTYGSTVHLQFINYSLWLANPVF